MKTILTIYAINRMAEIVSKTVTTIASDSEQDLILKYHLKIRPLLMSGGKVVKFKPHSMLRNVIVCDQIIQDDKTFLVILEGNHDS